MTVFWKTCYGATKIIQRFFYLFLDISGILLGLHVGSIMVRLLSGWDIGRLEAWVALVFWGVGALGLHVTHFLIHFLDLNSFVVRWLHSKLFGQGQEYFITR